MPVRNSDSSINFDAIALCPELEYTNKPICWIYDENKDMCICTCYQELFWEIYAINETFKKYVKAAIGNLKSPIIWCL